MHVKARNMMHRMKYTQEKIQDSQDEIRTHREKI